MKWNLIFLLTLWTLSLLNAQAAIVPEEAKKHMAFGAAALEMAKSDDGFKKAAVEFETAAKLAPQWSAPYYNLGVIYSKLEDWEDALTNYNKYLELSPKAKDAETVKAEIYKLEYKKQQQFDLSQFNGFYDSNGDTENPMFSLAFIDRGEGRATFQITYQRNDENFVLRNNSVEMKQEKVSGHVSFKAMFDLDTSGQGANNGGQVEVTGYLIPPEKNPNGETWAVAQFQFRNEGWIFQFKMYQKN